MKLSLKHILYFFVFCTTYTQTVWSQNRNPFEIQSRMDSVRQLPAQEIIIDTTTIETANEFEDTTATEISQDSFSLKEVNPFDVDHLPLRKNPIVLKKEVEDSDMDGKDDRSNTFIFWFLLLATALLAVVININFSFVKLLFRSLLNVNLFKLFHREQGGRLTTSQLLFYIIFLITSSTLIYLLLGVQSKMYGINLWYQICLGVAAFYIVKHLLLIIIGYIFDIEKTTSLYNFSIITYHSVASIVLLPLCFIAAFASASLAVPVMYIGLFVICATLLTKAIRGLFISLEFWADRFFQFFMYLCAFEILPVMVLVKFLWYNVNL